MEEQRPALSKANLELASTRDRLVDAKTKLEETTKVWSVNPPLIGVGPESSFEKTQGVEERFAGRGAGF